MFGLFKKKPAPEGPVELEAKFDVACSAEDFFGLIDFASPRNAKVELGHTIEQVGSDQFVLVMSFLPDLDFKLTVEECVPHQRYAYLSPMPEGVGELLWTRESFEIEATGENSCTIKARTEGEFAPGLTMDEYQSEVAMLTHACQNAFAKLKIHAEGGVGEVLAYEQLQAADLAA
ncbi:SRPBCC family protein [Pontixanthobacter aquaemixtae]|uniref:Uncharacterized protein n=1 Tax=Pontixanthobacter aquaemixtae TaxID=1958940 RepID=A0A844ZPY2_9SPHN|nr:hypothetical protein [Pontixanthobacter aquaemixtae]MXO89798.1 hypothetical protein [Pontixanthobacter aquaemixtae]